MEELAKILVLGVVLALTMAYLQRGDAGVRAWWSAKFLGDPPAEPDVKLGRAAARRARGRGK